MLKDVEELAQDGRNQRILDGIFLSESSQALQLTYKCLDEAILLLATIETKREEVVAIHG